MYIFLLFICSSISSLYGQDFLSKLPEGILQIDILPKLVIPQAPNQDTLTYIAHLIGYIEQTEYPKISKRPDLINKRLIKKSQLTNAPLKSLKCVNKVLNEIITEYKLMCKEHITEMIPQGCTLQEVLKAYPFLENNCSYLIYLPYQDQDNSLWNQIFGWHITHMKPVCLDIVFKSFSNPPSIGINMIQRSYDNPTTLLIGPKSNKKTITEKCDFLINFLDNNIKWIKHNNNGFNYNEAYDGQEEVVTSLRIFFYTIKSYNKAIEELHSNVFGEGSVGLWLSLRFKNDNDIAIMSPADVYELYKAMLGLF